MVDPDQRVPPAWRRVAELGWLVGGLWRAFGSIRPLGPEDGPPALVIPGFLANDRSTRALRIELAAAGWRVHGWGFGLNRGAHRDTLVNLRRRLNRIHDGRPVLLVGWSLGGVFARELAREVPDQVRAVVTLGSPFSGDPRLNNVWRLYERVAGHKVDQPPIPRIHTAPPVPTLALWSRQDGIVAPRAAYGLEGERDRAVELRCAHMAFAMSRPAARQAAAEIRAFLADHPLARGPLAAASHG